MTDADLVVEGIGVHGDGVAILKGERVFLPFALPGDRVRARLGARERDGRTGEILSYEAKAPRAAPSCPHFGECGGCALQHAPAALYASTKLRWLAEALRRHGLADVPLDPVVLLPAGTRRRARLGMRRSRQGAAIGFRARATHRIVPLRACAVLHPELVALAAPLGSLAVELLPPGGDGEATLTLTEGGIDMLLDLAAPPSLAEAEALALFAETNGLARLAWRRENEEPMPIALRRSPRVTFGGVAVDLPYDAFLQASAEADRALAAAVLRAATGAQHIAELFCGVGTFTFPLAAGAMVHAVERDGAALAALAAAARRAGLAARVTTEERDLAERPFAAAELSRFDAVLFDPPRAGALTQAKAIARSGVARVVAVSCNPATFARDAKVLVEGGFRIMSVAPFDSFIWSPHLELVARFDRP